MITFVRNSAKPPLLVFLGAGASVPYVPGVGQLTDNLLNWSLYREPNSALGPGHQVVETGATDTRQTFFRWLQHQYSSYWTNWQNRRPHFEELIHVAEMLGALFPLPPQAGTIDQFRHLLGPFVDARPHIDVHAGYGHVADQGAKQILNHVSAACDSASATGITPPIAELLNRLNEVALLRIVSLNYDDLPWLSNIDFFTGYTGQTEFSARDTIEPPSLPSLYQMHGSVRFGSLNWDMAVIERHSDRSSARTARESIQGPTRFQDGHQATTLAMITGLRKSDKVLHQPYAAYYQALRTLASEIPRWLVVGYGGGDAHVNQALSASAHDRKRIAVVGFHTFEEGDSEMAAIGMPVIEKTNALLSWASRDYRAWYGSKGMSCLYRHSFNELGDRLRLSLDGLDWVADGGFQSLSDALLLPDNSRVNRLKRVLRATLKTAARRIEDG